MATFHHCQRFVWPLMLCLLQACTTVASDSPPLLSLSTLPSVGQALPGAEPQVPAHENLLSLPETLRVRLDTEVAPISNLRRRADRLLLLLFGEAEGQLRYDYSLTLSAADTWEAGAGNCVSLSFLVLAAARHVGLDAQFQEVITDQRWERVGSVYFLNRHINVRLSDISPGQDYIVDLLPYARREQNAGTPISDSSAFSHYYNNLGAAAFAEGQRYAAFLYFRTALQHEPAQSFVWSNLGTLYVNDGRTDIAEKVLLHALQLNPEEYLAMSSLAQVYQQSGRYEQAEAMQRSSEQLRRDNPWYLALLAEEALEKGEAINAWQILKPALRMKSGDRRLKLLAAQIQTALKEH